MTLKFKWETEFKETEIGEIPIPEDWEEKRLEIYKIQYGKGLPENQRKKGDIPVVGSSGILGYHNKALAKSPGIIIGRKGNIGSVYFSKKDFFPIDTVFYIENLPSIEIAKYLYYTISQYDFNQLMSDSAVPGLNINILKNATIPFPSPEEQTRISTILSYFDDLIENKKKQNEILEKTAMAIFKSWFVDSISKENELKKEWEIKPLKEIAQLIKGVSYNSPNITEEPVGDLFITLKNFFRCGGFKTEYKFYVGDKAKEEQKVNDGDLIIALTDMTPLAQVVGAPAIVVLPFGYTGGIISLDCAKLNVSNENLRYYLYLSLKHLQEENSTFANGSNVLHLNTDLFMENKIIPIPPDNMLEDFHNKIKPLFQKIILNQKEIMVLRQVRDVLLPLLVFGKLRVEEM